jgi:hypothetical protein
MPVEGNSDEIMEFLTIHGEKRKKRGEKKEKTHLFF